VKDILPIRDNDMLVVETEKKEILIPFTSEICREIKTEKREIIIDPPEGLLELNEI
jgi:ribosomal 30S subunit maturation factor RimM